MVRRPAAAKLVAFAIGLNGCLHCHKLAIGRRLTPITTTHYNLIVKLDDQICYCFHVSLRKLVNYAKREQPARPSGMSECLGAGTGCGWCIPILCMIHRQTAEGRDYSEGVSVEGLPDSAGEYADARKNYLKSDDKNTF